MPAEHDKFDHLVFTHERLPELVILAVMAAKLYLASDIFLQIVQNTPGCLNVVVKEPSVTGLGQVEQLAGAQ
jgi:hypothetical protein